MTSYQDLILLEQGVYEDSLENKGDGVDYFCGTVVHYISIIFTTLFAVVKFVIRLLHNIVLAVLNSLSACVFATPGIAKDLLVVIILLVVLAMGYLLYRLVEFFQDPFG